MSQIDDIRKHLVSGEAITAIDALNQYQCFRLAAIIHILRGEGMIIKTTLIQKKKKKYAKYSLYTKQMKINYD